MCEYLLFIGRLLKGLEWYKGIERGCDVGVGGDGVFIFDFYGFGFFYCEMVGRAGCLFLDLSEAGRFLIYGRRGRRIIVFVYYRF